MWIHRILPDIRKYCSLPWTGHLVSPMFINDTGEVISAGTMVVIDPNGRVTPLVNN